MIKTTTATIQGHEVEQYLDIVVGEAILGANVFKDIFGAVRDIVGGRAGAYEREMTRAREIAFAEVEEKAKLLGKKSGERIKFRWVDDEDTDYYFELRIQVDEITKDVSLMITDFAEEDEIDEGKMLWDNMVSDLKQILGSK